MRILVLAALLLPSLAWAQFLPLAAFNVPTFANPAQTRTNLSLGSTGGAVAGTLLAPIPCGGDDYPALSALVTTAAVAGATVQLQSGTYSLNTGLVLGNNVYLTGAGESATFLKPGAAVASLVTLSGSNSGLANLTLQNLSARATNGLTINKAVNDLPLNVSHVQFILFPLGIQVLAGDNIRISDSFFNTNATNISLQCSGDNILNAWIERNFMLGGNGFDLPVPVTAGKHVEGLNVTENIVLPAMTGTFGMRVTAGLEIHATNNIFDQNSVGSGVIIDNSANLGINGVKLLGNWYGANAGSTGSSNGVWVIGNVRDIEIIGGTITGFNGYGVYLDGTTTPPAHVKLANINFFPAPNQNVTGDLFAASVNDLVLRDNTFGSTTNTVTETGTTTTVASGNFFPFAPMHVATSRYTFNTGDTGQELQVSGLTARTSVMATGSTAATATIGPAGPDSNLFMVLRSKGAGAILLAPNGTTSVVLPFSVAMVNSLSLSGSAAGADLSIVPGADGDTNVSLAINAKGNGTVKINALQATGHVQATGAAPVLTACGTLPAVSTAGNDAKGTVTEGATASGCTITFAAAYATAPDCVISSPNGASFTGYSTTTAALTITNASASGNKYSYICLQ